MKYGYQFSLKSRYCSIQPRTILFHSSASNHLLRFTFVSLMIISCIILLFTSITYAAIISAASCSHTDIQHAVDLAKTGDMVILPSCTNTAWVGTVKVSKSITITGTGEAQTKLIKPGTETSALFSVDCLKGAIRSFEFSNITLEGRGDGSTQDRGLELRNGCQDFIVHHSTFQKFGVAGVSVRDTAINSTSTGVVHHCKFIKNYRPYYGYGIQVVGPGNYPDTIELGTKNAVFVEDSYFEGNRHTVASNNGSYYVSRYNTIVHDQTNAAAIDAHGRTSAWPTGSRAYEIYNNTITSSDLAQLWAGVGIRGGDGVIFNNIMSGSIKNPILLSNDSDNSLSCTYPCPDQIRDLHAWNNVYNGQPATVIVKDQSLIQKDRDYFLLPKPGYTPYTYPHPLAGREKLLPVPNRLRVITPEITPQTHDALQINVEKGGL